MKEVRKGWDALVQIATAYAERHEIEMPDRAVLTPHILKHTAITWWIQNGASIEKAASFFSTSADTIEKVYWHHSPSFHEDVADALEDV